MTDTNRQVKLNLFLHGTGHHSASWRHPDARPEDSRNIKYYQNLAQIAEAAKFDSVFLADGLGGGPAGAPAPGAGNQEGQQRRGGGHWGTLEPFTLLSAVAAVTEHIGLIGTVSTTYNEPYHVARKFASLDHISSGRAGWNIVTTGNEGSAQNFSKDEHLKHDLRYQRADEFLEVATKLWDSWDDDSVIADKEAGILNDPARVRAIDHKGEWFSVRGPLNISRPPQGYPVLVQAGSSEDGKEFAARWAEAIFTAQPTLADAQKFYADVKARVANSGRSPEAVKILPGFSPIVGRTEDEAREKEAAIHDLIDYQQQAEFVGRRFKVDLSKADLDAPFPELPPFEEVNGSQSRYALLRDLIERDRLTVRQFIQQTAQGRGHRVFTGSVIQVADQLEEWFTTGAADGFNIMPALFPSGLHDFVELVIPELRRRGLFRAEYEGKTLRDRYGLSRPRNQYSEGPGGRTVVGFDSPHREESHPAGLVSPSLGQGASESASPILERWSTEPAGVVESTRNAELVSAHSE